MSADASDFYPSVVHDVMGNHAEGVLPEVHLGEVHHYTSALGLTSIFQTGFLHASHIDVMNDPGEREFGWECIATRAASRQDLAAEIAHIIDERGATGDTPEAFALSASTSGDELSQFRLYGPYSIELEGGTWRQIWDPLGYTDPRAFASWRPVLYGEQEAIPFIDRMLERLSVLAWNADAVNEGGLLRDLVRDAHLALEILALHIKHQAYAVEREVRLVLQASTAPRSGSPFVRQRGDRLVPYVAVRNHVEGQRDVDPSHPHPIRAVRLGPQVNSRVDKTAVEILSKPYGDIQVTQTELRYRG